MDNDLWIGRKIVRHDEVVNGAKIPTVSQALSVRIPNYGNFSRIWLPPFINLLREEYEFWNSNDPCSPPVGYLVGWKCGWSHPSGRWRMRYGRSSYDFALSDRTVMVTDAESKTVAGIHINKRFCEVDTFMVSNVAKERIFINYPLSFSGTKAYGYVSDEFGLSFRALHSFNPSLVDSSEYLKRDYIDEYLSSNSRLMSPYGHGPCALLFHPDDSVVVSSFCERWTPSLLTCLCIWARLFVTPRNLPVQ